jgi:hypothetical protein
MRRSGPVFSSFSVIFNRKMPFFPCISIKNEGKNRQLAKRRGDRSGHHVDHPGAPDALRRRRLR